MGLIETRIMEMGPPPPVQGADPAMAMKSRQFTGRILTVGNAKIYRLELTVRFLVGTHRIRAAKASPAGVALAGG